MTKGLNQVKYIKDEDKILVHEKDTRDRWNSYFCKLFSEWYKFLLDSNRFEMREKNLCYTFYHVSQEQEIVGVWKSLWRLKHWLAQSFINDITRSNKILNEWKKSSNNKNKVDL